MSALCAINRHGTDSFTSGGKIGYVRSQWDTDTLVLKALSNKLDNQLKSQFNWIISDNNANAARNIFPVKSAASIEHGTLDGYFSAELGMHGALLEQGAQLGNLYPNGTIKDVYRASIEIITSLLTTYVRANRYLCYAK